MSGFWWGVVADHLTKLQNGNSPWLISDVEQVVWFWRLQRHECMLQVSINLQEIIGRIFDITLSSILKLNYALPNRRQLLYNKADDWIIRMIVGCYLKINSSNPVVLNMGQERPVLKGSVDRQIGKQYFKSSNFQSQEKVQTKLEGSSNNTSKNLNTWKIIPQ